MLNPSVHLNVRSERSGFRLRSRRRAQEYGRIPSTHDAEPGRKTELRTHIQVNRGISWPRTRGRQQEDVSCRQFCSARAVGRATCARFEARVRSTPLAPACEERGRAADRCLSPQLSQEYSYGQALVDVMLCAVSACGEVLVRPCSVSDSLGVRCKPLAIEDDKLRGRSGEDALFHPGGEALVDALASCLDVIGELLLGERRR
jgi:hypothetical protein